MGKKSTACAALSRTARRLDRARRGLSSPKSTWEELEAHLREQVRASLQDLLEAEVEELLGRGRWERRKRVDAPVGYRNGYGKPRRLTLRSGTVTLRRPRVRGLEERFESRLLPLFARRRSTPGGASRRGASCSKWWRGAV